MEIQNTSLLPKISASSTFYVLASFTIIIFGLYYFDSILKPLMMSIFVWFIINKLKVTIELITLFGRKIPSWLATLCAIFILVVIQYLVFNLLIINLEGISRSMPAYLAQLKEVYDQSDSILKDPKYVEYVQKWITKLDLAGVMTAFVDSLSGILANVFVIIVYVIFFLMEEGKHLRKIEKLFPDHGQGYPKFIQNQQRISKAVGSYLWSKTLISLFTGGASYLILLFMNIEYAFLWSFLIFVFNFIPYIGPLISSLLPAIFTVLAKADPWQFVWVFAAMEGVQIVLGNFIEPMIMGKGSNLGPITVIVALAFWGMLWELTGMFMAIPITSIFVIICSQIPSAKFIAILLSEQGDIEPLN